MLDFPAMGRLRCLCATSCKACSEGCNLHRARLANQALLLARQMQTPSPQANDAHSATSALRLRAVQSAALQSIGAASVQTNVSGCVSPKTALATSSAVTFRGEDIRVL